MSTGAIESALKGMNAATQRLNDSARNIANYGTMDPTADNPPIDEINLSEEAVNMMLAKHSYKANVAVLKTQGEMDDILLSTFDKRV